MTPTQRKQLANILLKEGEEGWRVERESNKVWREAESDHAIDCYLFRYRAVRIERVPTRTPLPIEHYKCGSVVTIAGQSDAFLVIGIRPETGWIVVLPENQLSQSYHYSPSRISKWRWPNETEWKPAFTETVEERVVETLIVEGL